MANVAAENLESQEAWNGVLFDRFLKYRDLVIPELRAFGDETLRIYPPATGDRVLDIGCGFGDTTQQLAQIVVLALRTVAPVYLVGFHQGRHFVDPSDELFVLDGDGRFKRGGGRHGGSPG